MNGTSPEGIVQSFPVLTLEQVYGAITFYLANREAIDACLKEGETEFEKLPQAAREQNAALHEKLAALTVQEKSRNAANLSCKCDPYR